MVNYSNTMFLFYFYRIVIIFFGIGVANTSFAQEKNLEKTIQGIVIHPNLKVSNIHILNITKKKYTITDSIGRFEIRAGLNDTLKIKSIVFEEKNAIISTHIFNTKLFKIHLKKKIYILNEVVLSKHNLAGNLEQDIGNIPLKKTWTGADVGLPVQKGKPKEKIVSLGKAFNYGIPTAFNLSAIQKHINGYYKRLKDKRKWKADDDMAEEVILFYKRTFFKTVYHIPEDKINQFVFYCMLTEKDFKSNFKNKNHEFILEVFRKKSELFLKE